MSKRKASNIITDAGKHQTLTDRKHTEEARQQSAEWYRELVENLSDVFYSVDADGVIIYVSPAVALLLDYTPEELIGNNYLQWIFPEDRDSVQKSFSEVLEGKLYCEYRVLNKNGDIRWVRTSSRSMFAEGILIGVQGVLTDITEHKHAEEAIRRRAEEMDALRETVLDITRPYKLSDLLSTIVERATHLLDAEGGGLFLCDDEKQEVRCVVSYKTPNNYTGVTLKYGEGLSGRIGQSGESIKVDDYRVWPGRAKVFDGEQPFRSTIGVPMIWQGKVTGVIDLLRYTENVPFTEGDLELLRLFADHAAIACENARAMEEEHAALSEAEEEITARQQAEETLLESEEHFRSLYENSTIGLYRTTPGGRILLANPALISMLGYSSFEELAQRNLEKEGYDSGHPREKFRKEIESQGEIWGLESAWVKKDGSVIFVRESARVLHDANGQSLYYDGTVEDITDRKLVEKALQAERDFSFQVMNAMGQGLTVTGEDDRFEYVNPTYAEMTGYSPEELIGKSPRDITPPDDQALLSREIARREAGESSSYEIYLKHRQGQEIPVLVTAVPRLIEGESKGSIVVITDLTERKRAEEALRRERDWAQQYLDIASVMLVVQNTQGQVVLANRKACEVLGYEEQEVLGKNWVDNFLPKRMREKVSHVFDMLLNGNVAEGEFNENPILTRKGEERLVLWHNTVIRDETGNIIGHIGSGEDITERRRAEEALERGEAKYRNLAENTGVGIVTTNVANQITYVNHRLCEMIGFTEEELLGKSFADFVHPDDLGRILEIFQNADRNLDSEIQIEYRIVRKDGKSIYCFSAPKFLWEKGVIAGFSAIIQDITQRKQAEEKASREAANVAALARAASRLNTQLDLQVRLNAICEETAAALGFPAASISLYDDAGDQIYLAANCGLPTAYVEQNRPISWKLLDEYTRNMAGPLFIQDIQAIPDLPDAEIYAEHDFRTIIATNLMRGDQLIGILSVNTFGQTREISEDEKAMLRSLGDLAVQAIINARLYEDVRHQAAELARSNALASGLARVSGELQTTLDSEKMVKVLGKELKALGISSFLATLDSEENALVIQGASLGSKDLARIEKLLGIKVRGFRIGRESLQECFDVLVTHRRSIFSPDIIYLVKEASKLVPGVSRSTLEETLRLFEEPGSHGIYLPLASGSRSLGVLGLHSPDLKESDVAAFSVFANNISSALENARLYQAVQNELDERKRTEAALQEAEARYRALVEQIPAIAYTDSAEEMGKTLYINPQLKKIAGYNPEEWITDNDLWMKIMQPEDRDRVLAEYVRTFQAGEPFNVEYRIIAPDGRTMWFHDEAALIRDRSGRPLFWQGIMLNITESKRSEKALQDAADEWNSTFDAVSDGIYLLDVQQKILRCNDTLCAILLKPEEEIIGQYCWKAVHGADESPPWCPILRLKTSLHRESTERKIGEKWFEFIADPILDEDGELVRVVHIIRNISERKQTEESLRKLLSEKEVLLREVHHRVKNNLQAIIYLIEGRLGQVSDQQTILLLKGLQEQARTMALVYEQLYQSENLAEVKMKRYLQVLVENILEAFSGERQVEMSVESEDITLDIGTAMPCGLMVTELLTNSLKHAFPPGFGRIPCIEIKLTARKEFYDLVVRDNGVGLPEDLDERATGSMGLRLVRLWATHQMGGAFEVETGEGAAYHVTFPKRHG